jgi:hypothetical protein
MPRVIPVSRLTLVASCVVYAVVGIAYLFAPAETATLFGFGGANAALPLQLLGAAYLGFAALNGMSRQSIAGGIYSRPLLVANLLFALTSALTMLRPLLVVSVPPMFWILFLASALFAVLFMRLLLRPPAG